MPSKKRKYNARFPAGRIKKIMQTDEEIGKVAQAVPIIISRTLELFVHSLLTKTMQITSAKNAKTLSPSHMKQCILSESRFDFLKDLVEGLPDVAGPDEEVPTPPPTPAPVTYNAVCLPASRQVDEVGTSCIKIERKNSKDGRTSVEIKRSGAAPQAPDFQISVPTSFQANQPNFYTEVDPMNLSTTSKANEFNRPTSNFTSTANIDEDYDT